MIKKFFWTGYFVGILCFISLGFYMYLKTSEIPEVSINSIEMRDINGKKIDINKYTGKPVVINFWATWCAPCVKELPEFVELQETYKNKVNFIFVSDEDLQKINNFKTRKKYDLLFVKSILPFDELEINSRPTTCFYDKEGKLVDVLVGEIEKIDVEKKIDKLLN